MENLIFVIWMMGWPLVCALEKVIIKNVLKKEYSDTVKGVSALFDLIVWVYVAQLLYVG